MIKFECPSVELDTTPVDIDLGNPKGGVWCFPDGTPLPSEWLCSYEITSIEYPRGKVWGYITVPKWLFDLDIKKEFKKHGFKFKGK